MELGIDVSLWNTNAAYAATKWFDPHIAIEKGIKFAFIKASEGLRKDPQVDVFARTFADAGIPFGFYHFARPEWSYRDQCDRFFDYTKDYKYSLPHALDLERDGVGLSFSQAFLGRLSDKIGRPAVLYTSPNFWQRLRGSASAYWALDYPLWIANYFSTYYHPEMKFPVRGIPDTVSDSTTMPSLPAPFTTYKFWQFTFNGDGEYYGGDYDRHENKAPLDLNVYNGSLANLYAEFGIGEDPPIEIPTHIRTRPDMPADFLRFRTRPELYSGDTLAVGKNVKMELIEPSKVKADIDYWRVKLDGYEGYVSANKAYTAID